MQILIPLNKSYLIDKYKVGPNLIREVENSVVPNLLERLTSDGRVEKVHLLSNLSLGHLCTGSRTNFISHDSGLNTSFCALVEQFIKLSSCSTNILTVCNPLFPFVSIDKIHGAYTKVKNGLCNSAIGTFSSFELTTDVENAKPFDNGIFSVFKISDLLSSYERLIPPVSIVPLDAINLVSLRNANDFDLFELIINSGIMK